MKLRLRGTVPSFALAATVTVVFACASTQNGGFTGGGDDTSEGGVRPIDASNTTGDVPSLGGDSSAAGDSATGVPGTDVCQVCEAAGGQCSNGTCTISDNPGNVDPGTQGQLQGGGTADPGFAWVYPYDKTVFPRGLTSPTQQFAGTTPMAFYVTVTYPGMNYKGFYAANSAKGFALTAADWTAITQIAGPTAAVSVSVTKIGGGQVTGPITQTWTIAQGSLKGTIYYETYGSTLAGASALGVGIMKIQPGASAPTVVKSGCANVCHTVSADGSTLVAQAGAYTGSPANPTATVPNESASYDLTNNANVVFNKGSLAFVYGGIYPDGTFVVSATNYRDLPPGAPALYYTGSKGTNGGAKISAPGFDGVITQTGTPTFSPDGKMLAYNASVDGAGGWGGTLSVMDFDHSMFTFKNARAVATHTGDVGYNPATVAWPAFTPDSKWVVYHVGESSEFETDEGNHANLWFTSTTSDTHTRLDALDGYSGGKVYLPANDANLSFAPTVLPEAVGGYFWVVFTSHRSYGNMLASKAALPSDPLYPNASDGDALGKLWVAAIDINATAGQDPSHPAFYLDGQELQADNLRGFWVLSPCQANGSSCTSGDECCGGFCRPGDGGGNVCTATGGSCSNEYESCKTATDCCDHVDLCINGKCAVPIK